MRYHMPFLSLLSQKFPESSYHYQKSSFINKTKTHPYNTAHIVVELKLITTVLARIANGPSTIVNIKQKNAVKNVLAASDPRRPIGDSTKYAPSFLEI